MESLPAALDRAASVTTEQLLTHLPQLLGALALLLLGWVLARVMRAATRRGTALLNTLFARSAPLSKLHIGASAKVLGSVVYWVVLLFFVSAATQTLGLQTFTDWLSRLLEHLPTAAAGLLIMVAGWLLSGFVGELVTAATPSLAPAQRAALARVAQGATLVLALLVGADQIGLKITWIALFATLLLASVLGGLALAASLGARGYVANLIGAHYLRQALQPGQHVRVAGHDGRIVDINATSLVLETDTGRVMLPGRLYHEEAIELVTRLGGADAQGS
jgi:hypothetical protein